MKKLLLIVFLVSVFLSAQAPTYECRLRNGVQTSDRTYEFDVYLLRTGENPFELANLQMGIKYNTAIKTGTFTCTVVSGSSELNSNQIPTSIVATTAGVLKVTPKANPGAGSGTVISNTGFGTRVARFKITNSVTFGVATPNFSFSFSTSPYNTVVSAYYDLGGGLGTMPYAITNQTSHFTSDIQNNPLPVELASFTSLVKQRDITLDWKTVTELNFSRFEIERTPMKDNVAANWTKIADVKAAGNSNSPVNYSFTDRKLQSGKYQYRLKMVDNDGSFKYSKSVEGEVELPKSYKMSQNYPNPFNPSTRIDFELPRDGMVNLELYSINGEKVATVLNEQREAGYHTVSLSANSTGRVLASGMYIYRLVAADQNNEKFVSVKKMILMK